MKTAKDYLKEANAIIERVPAEAAIAAYSTGDTVLIDVRDSAAIAASGTVKGALRIPRGFLEFAATDGGPHYNPALQKDAKIQLICGAGGQAALAGKTLSEMGYTNVTNIGGFKDWKDAGGPTED